MKKKNVIKDTTVDLKKESENKNSKILERGMYSLKDLIAPESIDRSNSNYIIVGNKYVRNFIIEGFPQTVYVGWLDTLFNYDGDIDTMIHIEPADDKAAINDLTAKITQFESQLAIEQEKGNIRNLTRLRDTITGLYEERRNLERNTEKLYQVQITSNLYANSKEELEKETQKIDTKLKGMKIDISPTYLRQDEGYKSVLPYGKSYIEDKYRNFNSGALTACFPFYNNEFYHENGVFCGINLTTWNPISIDFYDRSLLDNSNVTVIGKAGSGKTFFVSLLTMRSIIRGIRTVIIDPEGEYRKLTEALGGAHIYLGADSEECINIFDIEESDILDEDDRPTGEKEVLINEKCADILNLVGVMAGGLTSGQRGVVSKLCQELYADLGINRDANSLYLTEPFFDHETKEFYAAGTKKVMPTFSDFYNKLEKYGKDNNDEEIIDLTNTLQIFKKGGIYGIFDCRTSKNLQNFANAPIVTFNVSKIEQDALRPIGMYIALSWTWEKFAKKNLHIKKRVVCDEAWMLVSKTMAGCEYTATFLETTARRIRKRNGGLLVASQNFSEFISSDKGQAVLKNSVVNIFLKQDSTDADALKRTFKLSETEVNFLLTCQRGNILIKHQNESCIGAVVPFEFEQKLIEKKKIESTEAR